MIIPETTIKITNLSKNFGHKKALNQVSLTMEKGMFGLLGRNGAGKTTLMRILSTLQNKSSGEVEICGISIEKASEIRRIVGYLPQDFSSYPNMNVYDTMDYLGILSGIPKKDRKEKIERVLFQVNLDQCYKVKIKALSGGMKRRLGIAQAIIHDPLVLITDEPTAGLDPEERVRFRNLLCDIAQDKMVILSTHIVEDIEKTCQNIAVLNRGEIFYQGTLPDFIGHESGLEAAYMKKMGGQE